MKTIPRFVTLLLFCLVAAGCGGLFQPDAPKTPREALAYSYMTVGSLADVLRVATRDGHVSRSERDGMADQLQQALDNLIAAEQALVLFESTGDAESQEAAQMRLSQAQAILTAVQSILRERTNE